MATGGTDEGGDEAQYDPVPGSAILAGTAVAGIILGALLVLAWSALTSDATSDPGASGANNAPASLLGQDQPLGDGPAVAQDSPVAPGGADPDPAVRCVAAARDLESSLAKARPALDQWAVHVGAMNKLVVGEISLQQASAFWEETRLGAMRRVTEFRRTWHALTRDGVDCPRPAFLDPEATDLRPCARQVQAQVRVLHEARTSIDTWETHVGHMDMMRLGTLSPEKATAMWLSMWQRGARDLREYRAAAQVGNRVHGCEALAP